MSPRTWAMRILAGLGGLVVATILAVSLLLLLNVSAPYQPFAVREIRIVAQSSPVCPGAPVQVMIDRRFTAPFDRLQLSESWVTAGEGRPVMTGEGTLPRQQLREQPEFSMVPSPLLTRAPGEPGTYRVRVVARPTGTRYLGMQATGKAVYHSSNTLTVTSCDPDPEERP